MDVKTLKELENIKQKDLSSKDDVIYCEETSKIYSFNDEGELEPVSINGEPLKFNNYELNKQIVAQLTPLDNIKIQQKTRMLNNFYESSKNKYYMLLCKEYDYYTLFVKDENESNNTFGKTVVEILQELNGEIYSIDMDKLQLTIEIWIKPNGMEEPLVFYLFGYDSGVVCYA